MKKTVLLSAGLFALIACNNPNNTSSNNTEERVKAEETPEAIVGGDRDEHGCVGSAGQTWSELRQDCIQVFNVGQRLNPIETQEGEAVISAFVVFNDDRSKVELFVSENEKPNTILDRSEGEIYQNPPYKFDAKESILYINGEKKYIAEK